MSHTQIFADQIAALMPERRIARLHDDEDIQDLAWVLASAYGVVALQPQIAAALRNRRRHYEATGRTWT